MADKTEFGTTADGTVVERVQISDGAGSTAAIIGWGAVLQRLIINGQDVVLGLNSLEDYINHSPYFGAIAGRVANRIAGGRFELNGDTIQLEQNDGANHLHGGKKGIGKQVWTISEHDERSATLTVTARQENDGYPGDAEITARFEFVAPGCLQLDMSAEVTEPCPINLAHHSYFNLSGEPTILDHRIQINAERFQHTDAANLPIATKKVSNKAYDFRQPGPPTWMGRPLAVDNNFAVHGSGFREIAMVESDVSNLRMRVLSDQTDVQLYCGHKVNVPVPGLNDAAYGPFAGLCLEPQIRPGFLHDGWQPDGIVQPGEPYRQRLQLKFEELSD